MNSFNAIGRLTADPDVRATQDGKPIARYTLAVDRGKDGADFIPCICFNQAAEFAEKHLHKGIKVGVSGRIQTGGYEKDGKKFYTWNAVVNQHTFCEAKKQEAKEFKPEFIEVPDDEELPFR